MKIFKLVTSKYHFSQFLSFRVTSRILQDRNHVRKRVFGDSAGGWMELLITYFVRVCNEMKVIPVFRSPFFLMWYQLAREQLVVRSSLFRSKN
jgi:hypothetical protein